jgi:outer membrane receptor protein involved in Fe transport
MSNGLLSRTQFGVTYDDYDRNSIISESFDFVNTLTNVDQGVNIGGTQFRQISENKGFFVQEELNYNDQIIATVGLRGDKSSLNGDPNQMFYYPKASVAINLHKMMDLPTALSNLKLRTAYGQSSKTP